MSGWRLFQIHLGSSKAWCGFLCDSSILWFQDPRRILVITKYVPFEIERPVPVPNLGPELENEIAKNQGTFKNYKIGKGSASLRFLTIAAAILMPGEELGRCYKNEKFLN